MRALALALALVAATGCVGSMVESLAQSDRSWCLTVSNPVYGSLKAGGTGIDGGTMKCTGEGLDTNVTTPGVPPVGMGSGGTIIVPRVLVPTYEELDTSPGKVPKAAPRTR